MQTDLPIQPLFKDDCGHVRFVGNLAVTKLLEESEKRGYGINELARENIPDEHWEQFAQLIGYSLTGFSELSYVTDDVIDLAQDMFENNYPTRPKIKEISLLNIVEHENGWIVGNYTGTQFRIWSNGIPSWTNDREQATRYARRQDAEAVHQDDEDAWSLTPYKMSWK